MALPTPLAGNARGPCRDSAGGLTAKAAEGLPVPLPTRRRAIVGAGRERRKVLGPLRSDIEVRQVQLWIADLVQFLRENVYAVAFTVFLALAFNHVP